LALARPQLTLKEEEVNAEGIDIIISMDTSSSMLNRDFRPNRIEASKKMAAEFVTKRKYDRIGLVVFAAEAFTQCPLTTDHAVIRSFISSLQCGMLEDGTAIGMGLASAVNRLKESEAKSKIIILLTDGLNSEGYINPDTAADIAKEFGIKIYTIGIGRAGRFKNSIDEPLLNAIAQKTGGLYYRAQSEAALSQIYDQIDQLEKTKVEINTFKRYSEEFRRFLTWGLIFLGLEYLLKYTLLKTFP
jgi:Ca-activated chloride channel family protein